MTSAPPDTPDQGGSPVDRRWFEEALRAQGFVVEPPDEGPDPTTSGSSAPDPALASVAGPDDPSASGDAQPAEAATERPPVPGALLARIAARGQAPDATPAPDPAASHPTDAAPAPQDAAPATQDPPSGPPVETPAPWAGVMVAEVPPWALQATEESAAADTTSTPTSTPTPTPTPDEAMDATASPVITADLQRPRVADEDTAPVIHPTDAPAPLQDAIVVTAATAALDSPYAQADPVPAGAAPAVRNADHATLPEASEGELWALVGASEPGPPPTSGSEAVRVILTILTAAVILVLVVGALVLASQMA